MARKLLAATLVGLMCILSLGSIAVAGAVPISAYNSTVSVRYSRRTVGEASTIKIRLKDAVGNDIAMPSTTADGTESANSIEFYMTISSDVVIGGTTNEMPFAAADFTIDKASGGSFNNDDLTISVIGTSTYQVTIKNKKTANNNVLLGDIKISVKSNIAKAVEFKVFKDADKTQQIGSTKTITWTSGSATNIKLSEEFSGSAIANGSAAVKLTATVKDSAGNKLQGVEVNFTCDSSKVTFTSSTVVTDEDGEAVTYAKSTQAGLFAITAKVGSVSTPTVAGQLPDQTGVTSTQVKLPSTVDFENDALNGYAIGITGGTGAGQVRWITDWDNVNKVATVDTGWTTQPGKDATFVIAGAVIKFVPDNVVAKIKVEKGDQVVATKSTFEDVTFTFQDANGNTVEKVGDVRVTFSKPAESDETIYVGDSTPPSTALESSPAKVTVNTGKLYVRVSKGGAELSEGEYRFKVEVAATGVAVETVLKAAKQGTVVGLALKAVDSDGDEVAVLRGDGTGSAQLKVYRVDAAGVKVEDTVRSNYYWITSDPSKATVDSTGLVTAKGTAAEPKGGPVTITVVDKENPALSASYTFTLSKTPSVIEVTVPGGFHPVNTEVTITAQLKDADGNSAAYADAIDYLVVGKPSGARVTVTLPDPYDTGTKQFDKNGKAEIKVVSDKAGVVALMVYDKVYGIAKRAEVAFGERVQYGAKNVVMFIGSTGYVKDGAAAVMDVAPVIVGGRTLVPVRAVAESLGFVADWSPKDGVPVTVSLTRPDIQITITIGSPSITVVKNGVATTVTSEVPAQIMSGRTMLPFRAIAEACGAVVDWGPKDAVPTWVSFTQQ